MAASCATPSTDLPIVQRSQPLLGTFVVVAIRSSDRAKVHEAISTAFDEVRRLDAVLSLHRPDSELVRLNSQAGAAAVTVSVDLFRVLQQAQAIAQMSDGSFDVTIRPLADVWGFISKEQRLPTEEEIKAVLTLVNYRLVELDSEGRTVRFLAPGVSLDLGGIAKGYIVDRALEILKAHGFPECLIRAGGDLRVSGEWDVQIEDPAKQGRRQLINLKDAAISTSGSYENYVQAPGKRYGHILDPRTGWPAQGVIACSVTAPTCMESDVLATAFFVLGPERALRHFSQKYPIRFVLSNGFIRSSPQFPK